MSDPLNHLQGLMEASLPADIWNLFFAAGTWQATDHPGPTMPRPLHVPSVVLSVSGLDRLRRRHTLAAYHFAASSRPALFYALGQSPHKADWIPFSLTDPDGNATRLRQALEKAPATSR